MVIVEDIVHLKRGNKLWEQKIMLPEHVEALAELKRNELKIPPPDLADHELAEIAETAMTSLKHELDVVVRYWDDGFTRDITGVITRVDRDLKTLRVSDKPVRIDALISVVYV